MKFQTQKSTSQIRKMNRTKNLRKLIENLINYKNNQKKLNKKGKPYSKMKKNINC